MDKQKSRDITKEDIITWTVVGFIIFALICLDSCGYDVGEIISTVIIVGFFVFVAVVLGNEKITKVAVEYPTDWDEIRKRIYYRDSYSCSNCGTTDTTLHVHHIVPLSRGGTSTDSNLVTLCENCHKSIHPHMR